MIPILGFLEGDTLGILVMSYPTDTVIKLIEKLQVSAAIRVQHRNELQLIYNEKVIPPHQTVAEIGIKPLEHFYVTSSQRE